LISAPRFYGAVSRAQRDPGDLEWSGVSPISGKQHRVCRAVSNCESGPLDDVHLAAISSPPLEGAAAHPVGGGARRTDLRGMRGRRGVHFAGAVLSQVPVLVSNRNECG
jgi:hypothetical protein